MRTRVQTVKHEVNQRVEKSESLRELDTLVKANSEYFEEDAGDMLTQEKVEFDDKIAKGRFASLCKDQTFYHEVISTLDKADQHMKKTIQEATDLLSRVVQVNPEVDNTVRILAQKIVEESMSFDLPEVEA